MTERQSKERGLTAAFKMWLAGNRARNQSKMIVYKTRSGHQAGNFFYLGYRGATFFG